LFQDYDSISPRSTTAYDQKERYKEGLSLSGISLIDFLHVFDEKDIHPLLKVSRTLIISEVISFV